MSKEYVWPVTAHDLEVLAVALVNRLGGSSTFQRDILLEVSEQITDGSVTVEIITDTESHSVTLRIKKRKKNDESR